MRRRGKCRESISCLCSLWKSRIRNTWCTTVSKEPPVLNKDIGKVPGGKVKGTKSNRTMLLGVSDENKTEQKKNIFKDIKSKCGSPGHAFTLLLLQSTDYEHEKTASALKRHLWLHNWGFNDASKPALWPPRGLFRLCVVLNWKDCNSGYIMFPVDCA